jgi:hypothetical protein
VTERPVRKLYRVNAANQATLGVVLDTTGLPAEVTVEGEQLSVIGYVWEPTTELVAVDRAGAVWKARVKRLKKSLKDIDHPAVRAGWWSIVLEQVHDEML